MIMMEQLIAQFPQNLQKQAEKVLPCSLYLQRQLAKHPEWIDSLAEPIDSEPEIAHKIALADEENALLATIRLLRHQNLCRVAWQDLTQQVPLSQTLADTSFLADILLRYANDWWYESLSKLYGYPCNQQSEKQVLVILGMGKLGGKELNFSSDIDLIFAFPEKGMTDGDKCLDNTTFFTRLAQKLINTFSKMTADGFVYRVDMRLRPFGDVGSLALSFDATEHYYQQHGRDWERYAFIKARAITHLEQGEVLLNRIKPFVYRRYLDYGATSQLRELKLSIEKERQAESANDIKLGMGGIREIEFVVQLFQLMRGGRESYLQQRNLMQTLRVLKEHDFLSKDQVQTLLSAYILLRQAENRLQMWDDQQTHLLPEEGEQLLLLAANLNYENTAALKADLDRYRQQVMDIFDTQFYREGSADVPDTVESLNESQWQQRLSKLKYTDSQQLAEQIDALFNSRLYKHLTELGQERFNTFLPLLVNDCAQHAKSNTALSRSLQIVEKVAGRSGYIALLSENHQALSLLVKLVAQSSWVAQEIAQSPILLDELLDSKQLYQPLNRQQLSQKLQAQLQSVEVDDTEQMMERLRTFKRSQVLGVAATDLMDKLPLMKVSDQLTWIAEVIVEETLHFAWKEQVAKYGEPCFLSNDGMKEAQFAVVAYGKLGGLELGYTSDLDIIFLHNSQGENQQTNGEKLVDNQVFFTRLAQRIVFILNTFTMGGRLYEIDMRLRPSGTSGLLVTSIEAFQKYQLEKAWTWEHQAIIRARGISGSGQLINEFEHIREEVLAKSAEGIALQKDIREMREKMWSQYKPKQDKFHLKKQSGGIIDIEFIVQYLVLKNAGSNRYIYTDNIRLLETLSANGCITKAEENTLKEIYINMRDSIHALSLQGLSAEVDSAEFMQEREFVQQCWNKYLT